MQGGRPRKGRLYDCSSLRRNRRAWSRLSDVNLLAGVGQDDVGAFGEVHVRSAGLHPPAGQRDLVADLWAVLRPAELPDDLLAAGHLTLPPDRLAVGIRHVEHHDRMRIRQSDLDNGSGNDERGLVVAARVAMMSDKGRRHQTETGRQHRRTQHVVLHKTDPSSLKPTY